MEILVFWASLFLPFLTLTGGEKSFQAQESLSISTFADPALVGPENLCIVFGGVIGTYSAGGNPSTDVYSWLVLDPEGKEIFNRTGGAQFETIKVSFNSVGVYTLNLSVRRNNSIIYTKNISISVQKGPELAILPDYLLCGDAPAELTAINPNTSNLNQYTFLWTDIAGNPVGNTNSILVNQEGFYKIELFLRGSSGQPVCLITGSTYVGPSLDFELTLSKKELCLGESQQLGTDTPLAGEWFLIRPNSTDRTSLGNAFGVELEPEDLDTPGVYTVIFSAQDPEYPDCTSERKTTFEVLDPPQIFITPIAKPDNCAKPNGAFQVTSQTPLDSLFIVETGFLATGVSANQTYSFTDLEPQIYTIGAFSNGCRFVTLFDLEAKDPPLVTSTTPVVQLPDYQIQEESCSANGVVPGSIRVTFQQGKVNGEFRILSPNLGEIQLGNFKDQEILEIPLEGGTYLLELKVEGCTYPVKEVVVPSRTQVSFTNPKTITICEKFDFVPDTEENLIFTLTYPDQTVQTLNSGSPFSLTQSGAYELMGVTADSSTGLCPRVEKFTASLAGEFDFELVLLEEDCFGNQVYQAEIKGLLPEQTSIRWLNSRNEIVGRSTLFFPTSIGDHSLIVQPLQSGFCPLEPIPFSIESPILAVEVELEATKICPEPGTSIISLQTNEEAVERVEWIYFDDQGNRRDLTEFADLFEVTVDLPGNYEAVVYNRIGCEIGRNLIKVEESTLLTPPLVEETYGICQKGKKGPEINPGDFAEYKWYQDDQLVSTSPVFSPKEVGNFTLIVKTKDGCEFTTQFQTYDACNFEYRFPNAMVLDDANRDFEVWINEGVTLVELYILNRQGALIHYEQSEELFTDRPIFTWNGKQNGKSIPNGTYVIVLVAKSPLYSYEEKVTGSLLVVD
jgi:hypothetical protein